jgi:hypothetical protein
MSNRAQGALELKRRNVSSSRSPGVSPERLNRARKLDPTRLGALRQPNHGSNLSGNRCSARRVYEEVCPHFTEKELSDLTLAAATINAWNGLAIAGRTVAGTYKVTPSHELKKGA